jgi:hypothetical protein
MNRAGLSCVHRRSRDRVQRGAGLQPLEEKIARQTPDVIYRYDFGQIKGFQAAYFTVHLNWTKRLLVMSDPSLGLNLIALTCSRFAMSLSGCGA